MIRISTLDAHVAGQPLRLIVGGVPAARGETMTEKLRDAAHEIDWARYVVQEPRGHRDLVAAVFTEPCTPDAHAGVLFMDSNGWSPAVGTGVMASVALAVSRGLLVTGRDDGVVRLDTRAGVVEARVDGMKVGVRAPPCTVLAGRLELPVAAASAVHAPTRGRSAATQRVDLVQSGASRFIVADAETAGVPLHLRHVDMLRWGAARILHAWYAVSGEPPRSPRFSPFDVQENLSTDAVLFTAPADGGADLRAVPVDAAALVDRSPSLCGVAALMAVLDAMELVPDERPVVVEGLAGLTLSALIVDRQEVEGQTLVTSEVTGTAWMTGEHTFTVDPDDPLSRPEPE